MKILTVGQANHLQKGLDVTREVRDLVAKFTSDEGLNDAYNRGIIYESADAARTALQNFIIALDCYGHDEIAAGLDR